MWKSGIACLSIAAVALLVAAVDRPFAQEVAEPPSAVESEPGVDPLVAAREKWARDFLESPRVHLELAKVHYDLGHLELAQAICEETRERFGDDKFDAVYGDVFAFPPVEMPDELLSRCQEARKLLSEGNATAAKSKALAALADWPESGDLHLLLGWICDELDEEADHYFERAAELGPYSALIQGWVARRLLKKKQDEEAALAAYIRTYFLAPHFYDTEYAEWRIDELGRKRGRAIIDQAEEEGDITSPLSPDCYWGIHHVLYAMNEEWKPEYTASVVPMLAHDSSKMRMLAMVLLATKPKADFEPQLDQLLQDPDPRVRGLALYIAMQRRGEAAYPVAREFLNSELILFRYDAISALVMFGGEEGVAIAREHAEREQHPVLCEMLGNLDG